MCIAICELKLKLYIMHLTLRSGRGSTVVSHSIPGAEVLTVISLVPMDDLCFWICIKNC